MESLTRTTTVAGRTKVGAHPPRGIHPSQSPVSQVWSQVIRGAATTSASKLQVGAWDTPHLDALA